MSSRFLQAKFLKIYFVLFGLLLFYHCAKQVRPSGGPEDKTPPKIIKTIPDHNSTLVPLDQEIEFHFNESMNEKSLDKAIFITPDPGDDVEYDWKGDRLVIEFKNKLSQDRTYVITLGTDLKDSHGNSLSASYTLAFSTGEKISDGKISGRVFSDQTKGILIWAYILNSGEIPNPVNDSPSYVTQTDNTGGYELSHLSKGTYRVFAIQDVDNNRFFEIGVDGIGVPAKDVELLSDSVAVDRINFKTQIQDTLGPAISTVSVQHNTNVSIQFDETVTEASAVKEGNYSISTEQKKSNTMLQTVMVYQDALDKSKVHLVTEKQTKDVEYIVRVDSLFDPSGNIIDPEFNYDYFTGVAQADTFRPQIVKHLPEQNSNVVELDASVELFFSEAMDTSYLAPNFSLLEDSTESISGFWRWPNPNIAIFKPANPLKSATEYFVSILLDSVFDIAGNSIALDSTFTLGFRTLNVDTFSTISGSIIDEDTTATGKIFMTAFRGKEKSNGYTIQLEAPGAYEFKNILPGIYKIEGFRDEDQNSEYSWGNAYPFTPSERFFVYDDSIKVRARWPNEGNNIVIQK